MAGACHVPTVLAASPSVACRAPSCCPPTGRGCVGSAVCGSARVSLPSLLGECANNGVRTLPSLVRRLAAEKPVPVTANMTVKRPVCARGKGGQSFFSLVSRGVGSVSCWTHRRGSEPRMEPAVGKSGSAREPILYTVEATRGARRRTMVMKAERVQVESERGKRAGGKAGAARQVDTKSVLFVCARVYALDCSPACCWFPTATTDDGDTLRLCGLS